MVIKDDSLEKELMQEVRKIILESLKDSYVIEYTQGNIRSLEEVFEIKQKQVKELQGLVHKLTDENNKLMQQIKELREKIDAYKNIIRILKKMSELRVEQEEEIKKINQKYEEEIQKYNNALSVIRELNEVCEYCEGKGKVLAKDGVTDSYRTPQLVCPVCLGTGKKREFTNIKE